MLSAYPIFVPLLLLLTRTKKLQAADMCRRVHEGKVRMQVLTGHVISTQTTHGIEECADLCDKDPPCYSVNYYEKQRKCELNDKTSFHHPEHMIQHVHGSYLDIHRPYSDCSDYFCDVRQVCKMDRVDRIYCKGKWMVGVRLSTFNYQKTGTYICILSRYAKLTAIYNPAPEPELSHHFTQDNGRQGRPGPGSQKQRARKRRKVRIIGFLLSVQWEGSAQLSLQANAPAGG